MNLHTSDTDELIESYFHADLSLYGSDPGDFTLADMTEILLELDARGICARTLTPPTWHTAASEEIAY